jgi:hypothetical protein
MQRRNTLTLIGLRLIAEGRSSIQTFAIVYTDGEQMAKAIVTKRSPTGGRRRASGRRAGWVRKNVVMDQRKLDVARRVRWVSTQRRRQLDQALDFVAFGEELTKGFAAVRRSGGRRAAASTWQSPAAG